MLFAIGTRIRFRYTGETGVITAQLDDGMLQVRLDSDPDFEIPAFEEDLQRDESMEPRSPGAKIIAGKTPEQPAAPPRREIKVQYHILKPRGLQLAFEPMPGRDGTVTRYKAWLLNDTAFEFLFEFDLYTKNKDIIVLDAKISGASALELGDLLYDDLSDNPEVWIRASRITTAGPDKALEKSIKIRPKQFFNSLQTAPLINVPAYHFLLLEDFESKEPEQAEDLRDYTKSRQAKPRSTDRSQHSPYKMFSLEELATFVPEIDLHIQNLMNGYARLDKSEILRIQLVHFQKFMDRAVRLGVPRVFIIHGVGEGKLRDAIAERLRENPHVAKFKNEFHHKYGYGATEVIFE